MKTFGSYSASDLLLHIKLYWFQVHARFASPISGYISGLGLGAGWNWNCALDIERSELTGGNGERLHLEGYLPCLDRVRCSFTTR